MNTATLNLTDIYYDGTQNVQRFVDELLSTNAENIDTYESVNAQNDTSCINLDKEAESLPNEEDVLAARIVPIKKSTFSYKPTTKDLDAIKDVYLKVSTVITKEARRSLAKMLYAVLWLDNVCERAVIGIVTTVSQIKEAQIRAIFEKEQQSFEKKKVTALSLEEINVTEPEKEIELILEESTRETNELIDYRVIYNDVEEDSLNQDNAKTESVTETNSISVLSKTVYAKDAGKIMWGTVFSMLLLKLKYGEHAVLTCGK